MGKRELLLIGAFLVIGLVVWRVTAPPAEPGAKGFSFQRMMQSIRSELQGHDTPTAVASEARAEVAAGATQLDLGEFRGTLVVAGVEGDTLEAGLRGTVYGADEAQAKAFASATTVRVDAGAETVQLTVDRPEMSGLPRLELTLRVPRRLALKVTMRGGRLDARGLAGVEYDARGTTVLVSDVRGPVKGTQRDDEVEIADVDRVELVARRTDVRIERVSGGVKGEAVGGQWLVRDVGGEVTIDGERADLSLERLADGLVFKVVDGYLTVRDEAGDIRGESRRCRLTFRVDSPGLIDVTAEEATVDLQIGGAVGARYDLRTENAAIRAPEDTLRIDSRDTVMEASGTIGAGGRHVKVRSRRGDITVRP